MNVRAMSLCEPAIGTLRLGALGAAAVALLLIFGSIGCGAEGYAEEQEMAGTTLDLTMDVDGIARSYRIYLPATLAPDPAVVLVFHGGSGDGPSAARNTGFNRIADEQGLIAVYPTGTPGGPLGTGNQWLRSGRPENDLAFISLLIDRLLEEYGADPNRVYVAGGSNGGLMSYTVACRMGDAIAAVGVVGTTMGQGLIGGGRCTPSRPIPVIHIHSATDPLVPFEGGASVLPQVGTELTAVRDTIGFWLRANGCGIVPQVSRVGEGDVVRVERYPGCRPGADVELYVVEDGSGHGWPGSPPNERENPYSAPPSQAIDATEVIWQFFARYPQR